MFSGLAQLIVLSLVVLFILSSEHSTRSRLLVAGAYGLIFITGYLLPRFVVAVLIAKVALGIALILVHTWEHGKDSFL